MLTIEQSLCPLSQLGTLEIKGEDATSFLQGQITCDVAEVSPTQTRLNAHCNLKGRMQSLSRLIRSPRDENAYWLSMPLSMVALAKAQFGKYALFSKVTIEDVSQQYTTLGLVGTKVIDALCDTFNNTSIGEMQVDEGLNVSIPNVLDNGYLYRIPGTLPRFELIVASSIVPRLSLPTFSTLESQAWEAMDIEAMIPTIYPQTIDSILPLHTNLVEFNAINFKKGCYLGQEIIARMHYKGKIKKHLAKASMNNGPFSPSPGEEVFSEEHAQPIGTILRCASNQSGQREILMVIDQKVQNCSLNLKNDHSPLPIILHGYKT